MPYNSDREMPEMPDGMPLDAYAETLTRVARKHQKAPIGALRDLLERIDVAGYCEDTGHDPATELAQLVGRMSMKHLGRVGFDALCKIRFSHTTMMRNDVEALFERSPNHFLVSKIQNSVWRWGCGRPGWNEIVDAYDGIRRFDFGVPGFEARLDHTTWVNERGWSHHTRTYLDGVFGYVVRFGGRHVLTIGFSVSANRTILLQQVQTTERRGNRWLYRLPGQCMPHVIARMRAAFPDHRVMLVDGGDVARQNLASYDLGLKRIEEEFDPTRRRSHSPDEAAYLERRATEYHALHERRTHLADDMPRLATLYRNTGPFALGKEKTVGGLRHYEILAHA